MTTALLPIHVPSIYGPSGQGVPLPKRMAWCTADMKSAIMRLSDTVAQAGGRLVFSDMFRSYEMQLQSHMDYVSGRKKAFSPPPGGSLHEAGRAFDMDLGAMKIPLAKFWELAKAQAIVPIIDAPNAKTSEAWHFECRGSHQLVYDYYKAHKGTNFQKPYQAMAASAILAAGIRVDRFAKGLTAARIQSALIRLGHEIGNLDGAIGPKSRKALADLGLSSMPQDEQLQALELLLQENFAVEYFESEPAPFVLA